MPRGASDECIGLQEVTDILSRVRHAVEHGAPDAYPFGTSSHRRGNVAVVLDVFRGAIEVDCLERFGGFEASLGFISDFGLCFDCRTKIRRLVRFP